MKRVVERQAEALEPRVVGRQTETRERRLYEKNYTMKRSRHRSLLTMNVLARSIVTGISRDSYKDGILNLTVSHLASPCSSWWLKGRGFKGLSTSLTWYYVKAKGLCYGIRIGRIFRGTSAAVAYSFAGWE